MFVVLTIVNVFNWRHLIGKANSWVQVWIGWNLYCDY